MRDRINNVATNKPSDRLTSGFVKVRQSEIVLENFSEIVHCCTFARAATTLTATGGQRSAFWK